MLLQSSTHCIIHSIDTFSSKYKKTVKVHYNCPERRKKPPEENENKANRSK
jgi:hypothetical protein